MGMQTPMKRLILNGTEIVTEDMIGERRTVATCSTPEDAEWVFGPLADFHGKVVEVVRT